MRRHHVPLPVLAAALSACVVEPELLNSERIEAEFGSYGIDTLRSSDGKRYSSLYSGSGTDKVCRTYAVVRFDEVPDDVIGEEHRRILEGGSIGATFKANGWQIYKETLSLGSLKAPAAGHILPRLMQVEPGTELTMHVYRLLLQRDAFTLDYATIVEVHHPDYLDEARLQQLYLVDTPAPMSDTRHRELTDLIMRAP